MDQVKCELLIGWLVKNAEEGGADQEASHSIAESMLLDLIGDEALTTAWNEAAENWWYA